MASSPQLRMVAFPDPPAHKRPCPDCRGAGVTGERYGMDLPNGKGTLLVDVFCPTCGGCGNGDPKHRGCPRGRNRTIHPGLVDFYDDDDYEDDDQEKCPSCQGREWNPVQGFSGEGEDCRMYVLRVPCGCTSDRVQVLRGIPDV